jgi:HPt (histidine-containing phosphotransfer) domain-containing protein
MSATLSVAVSSYCTNQKPKLDYLRELSGGDSGFIAEILEMFISEAPQAITQAVDHLGKQNLDMVRITVHKLKSSVQVVGGNHLTSLICEIESAAAKSEKLDMLPQMLSTLGDGITNMVHHLTGELQEIKQ